jgi:hypothetical protein
VALARGLHATYWYDHTREAGALTEAELAIRGQLPPGATPPPHKWRWSFRQQGDPRVERESVEVLRWRASNAVRLPKERLKRRDGRRAHFNHLHIAPTEQE